MSNRSDSNRRRFLQSSLVASAAVGVDVAVPDYLLQAAESAGKRDERVLVVVQLSGGNDGLNTVIPYNDDAYRSARPKLAIAESNILKIDDHVGFHPELRGMRDMLDDGRLAIVQGVGYDNPNRSHFESMDIWHTCQRKTESREVGWVGRYLDRYAAASGGDVPALHLGRNQQPLALAARNVRVPSVGSLDEFKLQSNDQDAFRSLVAELSSSRAESNDLLQFVRSSTSSAVVASERVAGASDGYKTDVEYPDSELARKLRIVAQLIDAGLSTRIYYVQLDGFDTHAAQAQTHAILLKEWSGAVSTFVRDLSEHDHADRVCVMTFSEFGRRVAENASSGTDHGAAAPMFLCGGGVQAGIHGPQPSLTDLRDGDLKHSVDFRRVYASVVRDWIGVDADEIIGAVHEPMPIFRSA